MSFAILVLVGAVLAFGGMFIGARLFFNPAPALGTTSNWLLKGAVGSEAAAMPSPLQPIGQRDKLPAFRASEVQHALKNCDFAKVTVISKETLSENHLVSGL